MSDDKNQSIQLDDIARMFEILERRLSRLENSFDVHRHAFDTMSDNVYSMYKRICTLETYRTTNQENTTFFCDRLKEIDEKFDDVEIDFDHLYHLMYCGDNFCGNCANCLQCPDGIYRCDITKVEIDPDNASCIRFKSPQSQTSDAEICKVCSDKGTSRCYECSHIPF